MKLKKNDTHSQIFDSCDTIFQSPSKMSNRIIHGQIPADVDGESPGQKQERLAAFTNQHFDVMNAAIMGGRATSMNFIHENGTIIAVTEGGEGASPVPATPACLCCGEGCKKHEIHDALAELAEELGEDESPNDFLKKIH